MRAEDMEQVSRQLRFLNVNNLDDSLIGLRFVLVPSDECSKSIYT